MDPENILKGRMAETLVEELLKKSGNKVYRFGYEAIVQNLVQLDQEFDKQSDVGKRIRVIPDFIVLSKKGNPVFVEVKFRKDFELYGSDRERLIMVSKFWEAKVIFVTRTRRPYFRICYPPYCDDKNFLIWKPLIEESEWKIDKRIYENYEELVHRYFMPTM